MIRTLARLVLPVFVLGALAAPTAWTQDDPPKPEPGTLELLVIDEDGEGIFKADARVVLTEEERDQKLRESKTGTSYAIESEQTDPDGFATLMVPSGEPRTIEVSKRGETSTATIEIEPMEPGESRELEVTLKTQPDLDVSGRVVDHSTGNPVAGVEVHVSARAGYSFGGPARPLKINKKPEVTTNANGEFTVRVRSWQSGRVTLFAPGWSPIVTDLVQSGAARAKKPTFEMRRGGTLRGQIKSELGGVPAGTTVILEMPGYFLKPKREGLTGSFGDVLFLAHADDEGRFEFPDLPSETPLKLRVEVDRKAVLREAAARTLAAGSTTDIELLLGVGGEVRGVVGELDGTPAADVEVWLRAGRGGRVGFMRSYPDPDMRTRTDKDGRYTFENVQSGQWVVGVAPLGYGSRLPDDERYASISRSLEVGVDEGEQQLVIHRGLYIDGSVELLEGATAPGHVSVYASSNGLWVGNIKVKDGKFRAGPLTPGEWSLTGRCFSPNGDGRLLSPSDPVLAEPGGDPVILRLNPGCGMSVSAVDPETQQVIPTSHTLLGDTTARRQMSGGARDTHEIWNLAPDTYTIVLESPDGRVALGTFVLEGGESREGEELELQPGGFVEVRYEGPLPYAQIELRCDGVLLQFNTVQSGTTEKLVGPVGKATVRVASGKATDTEESFEELRDVELTAGETARVEVTIKDR